MQTLKFKTNINCSGCVAKVTNTLNESVGEGNWEVDTTVPEKTLTIQSEETDMEHVEDALKNLGFVMKEV